MLVLMRNSQRDSCKGGKLDQRWLGPYKISEDLGKGVFKLKNPSSGHILKKTVNSCRLKPYYSESIEDSDSNIGEFAKIPFM